MSNPNPSTPVSAPPVGWLRGRGTGLCLPLQLSVLLLQLLDQRRDLRKREKKRGGNKKVVNRYTALSTREDFSATKKIDKKLTTDGAVTLFNHQENGENYVATGGNCSHLRKSLEIKQKIQLSRNEKSRTASHKEGWMYVWGHQTFF